MHTIWDPEAILYISLKKLGGFTSSTVFRRIMTQYHDIILILRVASIKFIIVSIVYLSARPHTHLEPVSGPSRSLCFATIAQPAHRARRVRIYCDLAETAT